jgi:L-alanine-DL-glutamate epimerase-like enolase superfamily enzyme
MKSATILSVEWARLEGRRPRKAGCNARLGEHGDVVRVPLARITTADGASGFGVCWASREAADGILGQRLDAVFSPERGAETAFLPFDFPLWDLAARRAGRPVYELAGIPPPSAPLRVPCYDTSLYFDDLHLAGDEEAADLMAAEARDGWDRGHRAFKIKVGRGARHLPLEAGTRRDVAIIRAVRSAAGPGPRLMLDANNGWNLNLTNRVLAETADCDIFSIEEPFYEDAVLYRDLKEWLRAEDLTTRIADGEGQASPTLLDWARDGLVDVIQYDIFGHGFTRWRETARTLDAWGVLSAPHHYGGHLGNYISCHLATAARGFAFTEWDEATTPGVGAPGYAVRDGLVSVPDAPGFGLTLDEAAFRQAVERSGWHATA